LIERAQAPVLWTFGIDMKDRGDLLKELEVSKWLSEQGMGGIMFQGTMPPPNVRIRKTHPSSEDS
jgi:hypothetical protein